MKYLILSFCLLASTAFASVLTNEIQKDMLCETGEFKNSLGSFHEAFKASTFMLDGVPGCAVGTFSFPLSVHDKIAEFCKKELKPAKYADMVDALSSKCKTLCETEKAVTEAQKSSCVGLCGVATSRVYGSGSVAIVTSTIAYRAGMNAAQKNLQEVKASTKSDH
jgi:hypothetical protein